MRGRAARRTAWCVAAALMVLPGPPGAAGFDIDLGDPVDGGETFTRDIDLQPGARVTVRAEDEAPNLGPDGSAQRAAQGGGSGGSGAGPGTGPKPRPCIPRRARVAAGRVGPARIGRSLGTLRRQGRVVYGTRGGRVRFLAVVSRSQARRPAALARRLRALGLR